jgi:hypothetical protein
MMHSNIAITDQIYVHVDEKERGQILSRLHQNTVGEFDNEFSTFIQKFGKEDLTRWNPPQAMPFQWQWSGGFRRSIQCRHWKEVTFEATVPGIVDLIYS